MTTSAEIAQRLMNELNRGSFLWTPERTPVAIRATIGSVEYTVSRHGNELRFYRPKEPHRWLSVRVDVHTDGRVIATPEIGARYYSSTLPDADTQDRLVQVRTRVASAIEQLGLGLARAPTSDHARVAREVSSVIGAPSRRRGRRMK